MGEGGETRQMGSIVGSHINTGGSALRMGGNPGEGAKRARLGAGNGSGTNVKTNNDGSVDTDGNPATNDRQLSQGDKNGI